MTFKDLPTLILGVCENTKKDFAELVKVMAQSTHMTP